MAFIRGQERMVSQTLGEYLLVQLDVLNWFDPTPPFGASAPLTLLDYVPPAHEQLNPNTLAMTQGPELTEEEGELGAAGGGLWVAPMVFFLDVYGESQGVAKALTSDLKAILTGKLTGTSRYQQMKDYSVTPAVPAPGHFLHFENVLVEDPSNQSHQRTWRVVKFEVHHEFNASEYGGGV